MIVDKREGIEYLMKNKKGNVSDLERDLSPELIKEFKQFNYIRTDKGKKYGVIVR